MSENDPLKDTVKLTPAEEKARRKRSIAVALTLIGLVALFYVVTIAKMGA
ncbi:protoheme IX farnesyltransferase [Fulvimarina sp. 2208YS6-2-32]|uniref:Protoheme IX farnesyltransferase n=1 Tax=Fulvimarina uroteuthidis TaxID=3098149 RepID=A0ABU5I143_9HYPH|nr:protoheme IX farnesyltransferase [Fulvimarina sp. 2208YS6-2-32]MDY8108534.1 protoheme IX farnesyltransferase [Fulvimarina sp. 2208YS6-2-32]